MSGQGGSLGCDGACDGCEAAGPTQCKECAPTYEEVIDADLSAKQCALEQPAKHYTDSSGAATVYRGECIGEPNQRVRPPARSARARVRRSAPSASRLRLRST